MKCSDIIAKKIGSTTDLAFTGQVTVIPVLDSLKEYLKLK